MAGHDASQHAIHEQPGIVERPESWLSLDRNEAKLAAYTGFTDRADFRRSLFSYPTLQAAMVYNDVSGTIGCPSQHSILRLVSGDDYEDVFPDDVKIENLYSVNYVFIADSNDIKKLYVTSMAVYKMIKQFENMANEYSSKRHHLQNAAVSKFKRTSPMCKNFPEFDIDEVKIKPVFGHFPQLGESKMERFNRALQMVCQLRHMIASEWNNLINPNKDIFQSYSCVSATPSWMTSVKGVKVTRPLRPVLDQKTFRIKWDRKGPYAEGLTAHLAKLSNDDVPPNFPEFEQVVDSDPRLYTGGVADEQRWRDTLRRQFNCQAMSMQIDRLRLDITNAGQLRICKVIYGTGCGTTWEQILKVTGEEPADSLEFVITFKRLGEKERLFETSLAAIVSDNLYLLPDQEYHASKEVSKDPASRPKKEEAKESPSSVLPKQSGDPSKPEKHPESKNDNSDNAATAKKSKKVAADELAPPVKKRKRTSRVPIIPHRCTREQLKEVLTGHGIKFPTSAKKDQLISLWNQRDD